MIISDRIDLEQPAFEELLSNARLSMLRDAQKNPNYFPSRNASDFENDVYEHLSESAKGTNFDKSITLISGHKFPDITALKFYGVEVKTSKQDSWKSLGNSVLESTRVDNVERIYLFFGRLSMPAEFKFRLYQECLYEVAVTHSPRYLIDMELSNGESIFDKMETNYDSLRKLSNPIKPIVNYYRKIAKDGEEPWWMDTGESSAIKLTVSLWSNLETAFQEQLRIAGIVRFPEIFSTNNSKYKRLVSWLAARHGVVDASLRDRFSAGGKVKRSIEDKKYKSLPRIFGHLQDYADSIVTSVRNLPSDEAKYYWKLDYEPNETERVAEWTSKVIEYTKEHVDDAEKFVIHLIGTSLPSDQLPKTIKERYLEYGFSKKT